MGKKNKDAQMSAPTNELNQTRVGIEIDGTEVHVAIVDPSGVVRVQNFRESTSERALDQALKAIPSRGDIVRVAFTGGRQYVRRLSVPHVPDRAMRAAMIAVAEENLPIVPGAASISGLIVSHPDVGAEDSTLDMVLAAVESDDLDPIWRKLGGRKAPITSSSFLLPSDGLYLRVARATSEMIILKGGVPLLARTLRVGGLDDLERRVYASQQAPSFDASTANPDAGKSAAEITDLYVEELVSEFRKTLVFWKREGADVPTDLIVLGTGAAMPTLLTSIRDSGFNILSIPEPRGVSLAVNEHEKPAAFQALAAAYSDFSRQPYAILPNPVYEVQKELRAKKAKQKVVLLASAVALLAMVFVAVAPLGYAKARETVASQSKKSAEKKIEKMRPLINANNQLKEGTASAKYYETGVPAYTKIVCSVLTSTPSKNPTQLKTINITSTGTGASIDTSAQIQDGSQGFQVIGDWQTRLERTISAKSIGTGSFTFTPATGTKDGSFKWDVPLSESFVVPNVVSCEGYKNGLSQAQIVKINNGYDPNDSSVKFKDGELVDAATGEPVQAKATDTTAVSDATKDGSTTEGGE